MPIPPWVTRAIPVVGGVIAAVTIVHMAVEILKPQPQPVVVEESVLDVEEEDEEGPLRHNYCTMLELPPNALDAVPEAHLSTCFQALLRTPVPEREKFIAVFLRVFQADDHLDRYFDLLNPIDDWAERDAAMTQTLDLLTHDTVLENLDLFWNFLELCPLEQRPNFLNLLHEIRNTHLLEILMEQLGYLMTDDHRSFQLVEALLLLPTTESGEVSVGLLLRFQDRQGFSRALRLVGDDDARKRQLVARLSTFSDQQLLQVNNCFVNFQDDAVIRLIQTLTQTPV